MCGATMKIKELMNIHLTFAKRRERMAILERQMIENKIREAEGANDDKEDYGT